MNGLLDEGRAVVTMTREVPGSSAPSVMAEYEAASRLAAEHLLALGHTRTAAIQGPPDVTSGRAHHAGLTAALAAAGVPLDPALVHCGPFEGDFGRRAAEALLDAPEPPTALLVSNHEASFGVLPVLAGSGLGLPDDLSLICTEEEPYYAWWSPPISTVDDRAEGQARLAAELLLDQLTGADRPVARAQRVAPRLVRRGSTAAPRDCARRAATG